MKVINQVITDQYALYNCDCVDLAKSIPDNSIDYTIYSPPFCSMYVFSNSERDMGNNADKETFWEHYKYLIAENFRITRPGRLVSIHCMQLPTSKQNDGFIGLSDFRGDIIKAHQDAGFIYHSEVCIWKDPVVAMQRTKALGLLHKTIRKDSSMSRQGIADYIVTMRKPGVNDKPIRHYRDHAEMMEVCREENLDPIVEEQNIFSVDDWQRIASPIWMDIKQGNTLNAQAARDPDDIKHISPLQLDVIDRCLRLWSARGDTVYTPFLGIGSELYQSIRFGRKGIGSELKESYFKQAVENLDAASKSQLDLFSM